MITGGVKFFEQSYTLYKNGVAATATSNNQGANNMLSTNKYTQWQSVGSTDASAEEILIALPTAKAIDRILLIDFNLKDFSILYFNGTTFVNFSNVIGVNGEEKASIVETTYNRDSAYYEFSEVTTSQIKIIATKSQVVDAQKFIGQFIATKEIGTFLGYPKVNPDSDRNETVAKTLSNKVVVQKSYETTDIKMTFKTYPYQADMDIIDELFDREDPFLVWPCGGRTGTQYFKVNQRSWRLRDVYNMQLTGQVKNDWEANVYVMGFNKMLKFQEHV